MPQSDGLAFLRAQMARRPLPVLVVSVASESGELVMQALDAGAVDVVRKPTALATDRVFEIADDLVAKVKAVAAARVRPAAAPAPPVPAPAPAPRAEKTDILVIGVSTGSAWEPEASASLVTRSWSERGATSSPPQAATPNAMTPVTRSASSRIDRDATRARGRAPYRRP